MDLWYVNQNTKQALSCVNHLMGLACSMGHRASLPYISYARIPCTNLKLLACFLDLQAENGECKELCHTGVLQCHNLGMLSPVRIMRKLMQYACAAQTQHLSPSKSKAHWLRWKMQHESRSHRTYQHGGLQRTRGHCVCDEHNRRRRLCFDLPLALIYL